jgi:sarcosine oxidase
MADKHYDVIVVGLGGMGSAAAYHLARRGKTVLGLEKFGIPHAMGSSHGVNRIIRLAYYEHPSYVPLLARSFELWRELESAAREPILIVTGSIDCADANNYVFSESLRSCEIHGLKHEVLNAFQTVARWPAFSLPPNHMTVYQPDGGYVMSERAIVAHVTGAIAAGATIQGFTPVLSWEMTPTGVAVQTPRGRFEAEQILFSAGAWMGSLVPELSGVLQPERQVLGWFWPENPDAFQDNTLPVFNLAGEAERWYGFPMRDYPGFKFGKYHHRHEQVDPDEIDRIPNAEDEETLRVGLREFFPTAARGPVLTMAACMFTNTPDEHFIIDRLAPGSPVVVASPCSGHGYKFAAVMGEILADLICSDETRLNIDLFRLNRFNTQT